LERKELSESLNVGTLTPPRLLGDKGYSLIISQRKNLIKYLLQEELREEEAG
jgi:hypothetical protein